MTADPQGLSALKPCPFCGKAPSSHTFETESLFSHAIVPWLSIKCDACDCAQIEGEQFDGVRTTWNTRSEGPQPPAVKVDEGVREKVIAALNAGRSLTSAELADQILSLLGSK